MATLQECREALTELTKDIADAGEHRQLLDLDRSLSAKITDLDTILKGRLAGGAFVDVEESSDPAADIKLTLTSDDLVAMCHGHLHVMKAMATGKLKLQASMGDMMKLRKLLK